MYPVVESLPFCRKIFNLLTKWTCEFPIRCIFTSLSSKYSVKFSFLQINPSFLSLAFPRILSLHPLLPVWKKAFSSLTSVTVKQINWVLEGLLAGARMKLYKGKLGSYWYQINFLLSLHLSHLATWEDTVSELFDSITNHWWKIKFKSLAWPR